MLLFLLAAGRRLVAPRRSWCAAVGDLHLHEGCRTLPPMVQADGTRFGLPVGLVRPPSSDALWGVVLVDGKRGPRPGPVVGRRVGQRACLAQHVRATPADVQDKRVVELGSGLGVCGVAAALSVQNRGRVCGSRTGSSALRDGDRPAERVRRRERAPRDLRGPRWRVSNADVVLAPDVLYDARDMEALAEACKRLAPRACDCGSAGWACGRRARRVRDEGDDEGRRAPE